MFIYVGCAGGASSSMLCNRFANALQVKHEEKKVTSDSVKEVLMKKEEFQNTYDIVIAYGGIDFITADSAQDFGEVFDIVLVAPQVRYRATDKAKLLADYPTIVTEFPMKLYGTMDVEGVNTFVQDLISQRDS